MDNIIRIGTRESQLAVWQAEQVKGLLQGSGHSTELVFIKSEGDIDLKTPLYEMGVQGIFTRSLDIALLNNKADIAVHSFKDVPTQLPEGLEISAILPRGNPHDLLVFREGSAKYRQLLSGDRSIPFTLATSSIRRKAQWLARFPWHRVENLRGNVNTRLKTLAGSDWDAAIFAAAGLERIGLRPSNAIEIEWMLPAPAQGAIAIASRNEDKKLHDILSQINDPVTTLCTHIERSFLRALMGGCSTPISGYAWVESDLVHFSGNIFSPDGRRQINVNLSKPVAEANDLGEQAAGELIRNGAGEFIQHFQDARQ